MSLRLIEVMAAEGHVKALTAMAGADGVLDCHRGPVGEDGRRLVRFLTSSGASQKLLDRIQGVIGSTENWRIIVLPVEASIVHTHAAEAEREKLGKSAPAAAREELYDDVADGTRVTGQFLAMTVMAVVVAAIGLGSGNVAVIIGAMIVAPLLGPNLAFALAAALGDRKLMGRALFANLVGVSLSVALCLLMGVTFAESIRALVADPALGGELLARTRVGEDSIALALVSGAAAALSLTSGRLSATLVGVMVAVALMPPAVALGLLAGAGAYGPAAGAGTLLAVNVVCVNLAAQIVFILRGIKPRTWAEKRGARHARLINLSVWALLLAVLAAVIWVRR